MDINSCKKFCIKLSKGFQSVVKTAHVTVNQVRNWCAIGVACQVQKGKV